MMDYQPKSILFACAASVAVGMGIPAAEAADAPRVGQVDEVVVTARRKEESLQSVPVAVVALSARQLQAQGVATLADIQRVAPGMTVSPGTGGTSRPAYQIRGQRTVTTGIAFDAPIGVYFAEVANGRAAGTPQSLFDLSSVQVLKGPQGTLFGRNTTGGAILITPSAPTREFEGYMRGATGSFALQDVEGVVNVPAGDLLQVRFAGRYYKRDGWFRNVIDNTRTYDEDNTSLRLSVRVTPTDNITSDFIATSYFSKVAGFQTKIYDVDARTVVPIPGLLASMRAELAASNALGFYEYRQKFVPLNKDDVKSIQNTTTIELGDSARIKNIAGYRKLKNFFSSYGDGTALGLLETRGSYYGDQFSNELQLQGDAGNLNYLLGLYYFKESGDELGYTKNFGVLPRNYNEYRGVNKSRSAFAHIDYNLGDIVDGLSLSGGIRITKDNRFIDGHQRQERVPTAALPAVFVCTASGAPRPLAITRLEDRGDCSVKTRASFTEPTWDASLNWQMDADHLLYLAHRHGYRAGAAALITAPALLPEKVNDIEFGSKNSFDLAGRTARLNVAAFYGKYTNLQRSVAVFLNGTAIAANLNAGKSHVYGLEAEFQLPVTDDLRLSGSYALTKGKYDEFKNFVNNANCPTGCTVDNSSATFAHTPERAFSLLVTYDLPVPADDGELSVSLSYSYMSRQQSNDSNSKPFAPSTNTNGTPGPACPDFWCLNDQTGRIPAYGIVGLRADWSRPMGAGVDLGVFVTNLTGKKYTISGFALQNALGFVSRMPGPPRMFGVELKVPFGAMRE